MPETVYRITQIEPQQRAKDRFNIYLDGAFAFGLDGEVVLKHHLHEGDELTDTVIDGVILMEERSRAKKKALALLSRSARSMGELRERLRGYGFSERTIAPVVADFLRVGLLDDRAFAEAYVRSRLAQRPMGRRLLKQELLHRGVDEDAAEAAVGKAYGSVSEADFARQLVHRKMKSAGGGDTRRLRQKLVDMLMRRGFDWDVIASAVQEKGWENEG